MDAADELRARLRRGQPVLGLFAKSQDPAFTEISGCAGFDFIILDMEHGPLAVPQIEAAVRAADAAGIVPIARVSSLEQIGKVLDVGAAGIQVPQVGSREEAARALAAAKFGPRGERGVCRFVRAARYSSTPKADYFQQANRNLVVLQIEGKAGLDCLEEILALADIDVLFIGPYDLSQSLGIVGQIEAPQVVQAMEHILSRCREKGIAVGTFVETPKSAKRWIKLGVQYIACSVDVAIYYQACREIVEAVGTSAGAGE